MTAIDSEWYGEDEQDNAELVDSILRSVEINPSNLRQNTKARLVLLADQTETIQDELSAMKVADDIFRVATRRGHAYSEKEQHIVKIGTLFTDIGKTGPPDATIEQSQIFVDIYAIENLPTDVLQGSLHSFLQNYFPRTADSIERVFASLGLSSHLTLRQFYDLHTAWTLKIIDQDDAIPPEPKAGAAAHHRMRDDDPDGMFAEASDIYSSKYDFGTNHAYDRAEKLINVLDIYDALCRRSGLNHFTAMLTLRDIVQVSSDGRFMNDPEILEILDDLDSLGPLEEACLAS